MDDDIIAWLKAKIERQFGENQPDTPTLRMRTPLQRYSWPGNVRELSNVIERAMILASGDTLHVELPSGTQNAASGQTSLKENERELILRVLQDTGWRIRGTGGAAQLLGVKPTALEWRMAKLGIKRPKKNSSIP